MEYQYLEVQTFVSSDSALLVQKCFSLFFCPWIFCRRSVTSPLTTVMSAVRALLIHVRVCELEEVVGRLKVIYSYAPHNDVSANDGPHIRRWSRKIII